MKFKLGEVNPTQNIRPTINRKIPARLNDYEIISDNVVDEVGEIIHLIMMAGAKPFNF